jgi:hypothetical protein
VRGHRGHLLLLNVLMAFLFPIAAIAGGVIGSRVAYYTPVFIVGGLAGGIVATVLLVLAYLRFVPMLMIKN